MVSRALRNELVRRTKDACAHFVNKTQFEGAAEKCPTPIPLDTLVIPAGLNALKRRQRSAPGEDRLESPWPAQRKRLLEAIDRRSQLVTGNERRQMRPMKVGQRLAHILKMFLAGPLRIPCQAYLALPPAIAPAPG